MEDDSQGDNFIEKSLATEAEIDTEANGNRQDADDDGQDGDPLEESWMYNNINNCNNMSRFGKWVPSERVQENTSSDGYIYTFISPADGPMLSPKSKEQVMVLNYLLQTPPHRRRILNTSSLVATFTSDGYLETLVQHVPLTEDEQDVMEGAREDIGNKRVDCIPLNQVCVLRCR